MGDPEKNRILFSENFENLKKEKIKKLNFTKDRHGGFILSNHNEVKS